MFERKEGCKFGKVWRFKCFYDKVLEEKEFETMGFRCH